MPGGEWVAAIHVEGRSQEPEACDEAGGTDNVHLTADVAILDTTRVTLEVAWLRDRFVSKEDKGLWGLINYTSFDGNLIFFLNVQTWISVSCL